MEHVEDIEQNEPVEMLQRSTTKCVQSITKESSGKGLSKKYLTRACMVGRWANFCDKMLR